MCEMGGALNLVWGHSRVRFERGCSGTVLEEEVRSALLICRNKMGVTLMQRGKVATLTIVSGVRLSNQPQIMHN